MEVEIIPEEEAEVSSHVHITKPPPTTDVLIRERGNGKVKETGGPISASLGALRALIGKLDMLPDPSSPQGCSSKRVKDGICLLKDDVEKLSSYLDDLSEVEDPPPTAKCWMNEVRDLSYDMENYIDNLLFVPLEDPSIVTNNIKTTVFLRKWFSRVKTRKTQDISAETLLEFRIYVQEAIQRHQRYNLHSCQTMRPRFASLGPMAVPRPYEETSDIVIDGEMNKFMNSLANDGDQQLKVLSVLGSSCLGKTTLARVFYSRFRKQYSCRAFIRVSKKPDTKRIFWDMLSQLQRQHPPQHCREIDLIHDIKQYLQDKRYLIIIDDVWAASVWDIINHVFPKGIHGSRIVTTTQIEDVALTCCCYQSEYVFEMKHLDDYHSRKLFFNRLFGSERDCPEQFKDVLNEIVETCDGLPLATVSIASLIASQPVMSIDLFTYIHRSLSSCFSASEKTRQALNLSFNNLPHYLKTCLMYLIMYPEGYIFCKDDLMKQLLAEGFIDTAEGQNILKVAESYLDQLIGRRFIQPICINYNNEVLSCAVHDVVHDLIAHKSAEDNFIVKIDQSRTNVPLSHKVRRLSLLFGNARYAKMPVNIRKSQVRSLTLFGSFECIPCIREFKLLRVLNLQLSSDGGDDGPIDLTGISELYQLRYLKIASDVCIKLPNHGLQCLETLDIMDTKIAYAPWNIQLPNLLHLSLPVEKKLLDCFVSLGRLGKLNNLQDLHLTIPSTHSHVVQRSLEALGCLIGGHVNLKTIQVVAHGSSSTNALVRGASEVTISWYDLAPPLFLQRLECSLRSCIIFYNVPMWVGKLDSLCILKISVRELMMDSVDILRGLPALTALSLYVQRTPIERIIFDKAGFLVLEYFKLRLTSGIAWLKFEKDAMPNLLKLKLVFKAIPPLDQHLYSSDEGTFKQRQLGTAVISIEHMPRLKEISVKIGGAAAYLEYASRTFVSNHPSNPTVNMQLVDHSSSGDESTKQKQQQPDEYYTQLPDKILEEEPDEYAKTLERPSYKRISRPPESSLSLHVPGNEAPEGAGDKSQSIQLDVNKVGLHEFTVDELMSATSNFSDENFLGEGTVGTFYKGTVNGELVVAITKLPFGGWLWSDYCNHHPHLVRLLGYCDQDKHITHVYEYMPRGSLKHHLLTTDLIGSLSWLTRLKIAVGAAKGLAFLHGSGEQIMYYTGFTASSILLDSDYTAKLLGFGLGKQDDAMVVPARIKSDVYNFGVVLLELLAGRPAVDDARPGRETDLVMWSCSRPFLLSKDQLRRIMDPKLEGHYSLSAAWRTAKVARQCMQGKREKRLLMRNVVDALEPLLNDDSTGRRQSKKTSFSQCFIGSKAGADEAVKNEKGKTKMMDEAVKNEKDKITMMDEALKNEKGKITMMDEAVKNEKGKITMMDEAEKNEKDKTKMMEEEPDEHYKQQPAANAMAMAEDDYTGIEDISIWTAELTGR